MEFEGLWARVLHDAASAAAACEWGRAVRARAVAPALEAAAWACLAMSVMLVLEVCYMSVSSFVAVNLLRRTPERRYSWEPMPSGTGTGTARGDDEEAAVGGEAYPMVLVQIPMYNEREVYKISIGAACALTWPPDRIIIQVLDDSTDPFIKDAVDAVPLNNQVHTIIRIGPGVHRQQVHIPKTKNFITLCGSSIKDTVICWDNRTTCTQHTQPSGAIGTGTLSSATIIVEGDDFIAEDVIFKNSAPQVSGQAAAVRVMADRCAFYDCRFLGWQETLHLHGGKQFLKNCYIEGNYDFIFGDSTALLEHCHIHCKSAGYITAHGRKSSSESTGFVFFKCVITGNGEAAYMYLGRPLEPFGRVVFAETFMDHCIEPVGWHNWDKPENEQTACFYEYRCSGPGSSVSGRVPWCKELFGDEAIPFLVQTLIDPDIENPWLVYRLGTRVPVSASSLE